MIGNVECAMRNLLILTAYPLCARSGEAEFSNLDRSAHDALLRTVFFKVPQEKVNKWKVSYMTSCPKNVRIVCIVQVVSELFVNPVRVCPSIVRGVRIMSELFVNPVVVRVVIVMSELSNCL